MGAPQLMINTFLLLENHPSCGQILISRVASDGLLSQMYWVVLIHWIILLVASVSLSRFKADVKIYKNGKPCIQRTCYTCVFLLPMTMCDLFIMVASGAYFYIAVTNESVALDYVLDLVFAFKAAIDISFEVR